MYLEGFLNLVLKKKSWTHIIDNYHMNSNMIGKYLNYTGNCLPRSLVSSLVIIWLHLVDVWCIHWLATNGSKADYLEWLIMELKMVTVVFNMLLESQAFAKYFFLNIEIIHMDKCRISNTMWAACFLDKTGDLKILASRFFIWLNSPHKGRLKSWVTLTGS